MVGPSGVDDGSTVTVSSPAAVRVLLIADDPKAAEIYGRVLEFVGYDVTLAADFLDVLGTSMPDPDLIVLCNLAALPFPGQTAHVIKVPEGTAPDVVVTEVYRRLAPPQGRR
jgi:CheY-like chemotaxis protein